jgi:nitroreductase
MEFKEVVSSRFSVRKYNNSRLSEADIKDIVEIGLSCPSARNQQSSVLIVVDDPKEVNLFKPELRHHFDAPAFFVVCYDAEEYPTTGKTNAVILLNYLMLAAVDKGFGTCWTMSFDPELVKARLGIPYNYKVEGILIAGNAASDAVPNESHFDRDQAHKFYRRNKF